MDFNIETFATPFVVLLTAFGVGKEKAEAIGGMLVALAPVALWVAREWQHRLALRDARIGAAIKIVEERKRPAFKLESSMARVQAEDEALRMGVKMPRGKLGKHIERIGPKVVDGFGQRSKAPPSKP